MEIGQNGLMCFKTSLLSFFQESRVSFLGNLELFSAFVLLSGTLWYTMTGLPLFKFGGQFLELLFLLRRPVSVKDVVDTTLLPQAPQPALNIRIFLHLSNVLDEVIRVSSKFFAVGQWMLTHPTFT